MARLELDSLISQLSPDSVSSFEMGYAVAGDPTADLSFGGNSVGTKSTPPYVIVRKDAETTSNAWFRERPFPEAAGTLMVEDPTFILGSAVRAYEMAMNRRPVRQVATLQEGI